jgi:hypothetical protein
VGCAFSFSCKTNKKQELSKQNKQQLQATMYYYGSGETAHLPANDWSASSAQPAAVGSCINFFSFSVRSFLFFPFFFFLQNHTDKFVEPRGWRDPVFAFLFVFHLVRRLCSFVFRKKRHLINLRFFLFFLSFSPLLFCIVGGFYLANCWECERRGPRLLG